MKATHEDDLLGTRGQTVYRAILAAIRARHYRPGDRLREEEVAARLGVSRTPVREALGRLQEKGLVEAAAGRGLAVARLGMQQVLELYAMREELEGAAARFAAQQASPVELDNLVRLNAELAAAEDDAWRAAEINRVFHERLYDAARNRYLSQALDDLQDTVALLPSTTFQVPGRAASAAQEHRALLEALSARDSERAQALAAAHIRAAFRTRLAMAG
ncbi:GntR family transcriptional regulator [Salinarimonas sp.]|uniref:GntR family transcriptional regulator n=1 Tax=Salinarimonas sp. TaxID=2766526 RepID=UPI0032D8DE01